LNLSTSLFFIIGTDGYFKYISPAVTALLGFSEEELLSRPYTQFMHPDDSGNVRQKAKRVLHGRELQCFSNRYITTEGTFKCLSWTATDPSSDGYIYAIAQDQTESTTGINKAIEALDDVIREFRKL